MQMRLWKCPQVTEWRLTHAAVIVHQVLLHVSGQYAVEPGRVRSARRSAACRGETAISATSSAARVLRRGPRGPGRDDPADASRVALGRVDARATFGQLGRLPFQTPQLADTRPDFGVPPLEEPEDVAAGGGPAVADGDHLADFGKREPDRLRSAVEAMPPRLASSPICIRGFTLDLRARSNV